MSEADDFGYSQFFRRKSQKNSPCTKNIFREKAFVKKYFFAKKDPCKKYTKDFSRDKKSFLLENPFSREKAVSPRNAEGM